jgi:hypothetical protein
MTSSKSFLINAHSYAGSKVRTGSTPAVRAGARYRSFRDRVPSCIVLNRRRLCRRHARATQLGVSPEDAERQDFAPDSPRGNAICRMVDATEVAFVAVFLASDKAWAVSGELVAASGGAGRSVFY